MLLLHVSQISHFSRASCPGTPTVSYVLRFGGDLEYPRKKHGPLFDDVKPWRNPAEVRAEERCLGRGRQIQ